MQNINTLTKHLVTIEPISRCEAFIVQVWQDFTFLLAALALRSSLLTQTYFCWWKSQRINLPRAEDITTTVMKTNLREINLTLKWNQVFCVYRQETLSCTCKWQLHIMHIFFEMVIFSFRKQIWVSQQPPPTTQLWWPTLPHHWWYPWKRYKINYDGT